MASGEWPNTSLLAPLAMWSRVTRFWDGTLAEAAVGRRASRCLRICIGMNGWVRLRFGNTTRACIHSIGGAGDSLEPERLATWLAIISRCHSWLCAYGR